jgi:hypothetical protein
MSKSNHQSAPKDESASHTQQYWEFVKETGGGYPLPSLDFPPNPELVAQGWERRFMADPIRLKEAVQLYEELGYEVHIEAVKPTELSEICGDCRLTTCFAYQTIYTRKKLA